MSWGRCLLLLDEEIVQAVILGVVARVLRHQLVILRRNEVLSIWLKQDALIAEITKLEKVS